MSEGTEQQINPALPWKVEAQPVHGWRIVDANGSRIVCDIYWEAHARLIVKAANAHYTLVDAAQFARSVIDKLPPTETSEIMAIEKLTAALALAEKES